MELVRREGWQLADEPFIDNNVSASKARGKGTAWAAMLAGLAAGRADVVVGVDLDRLVRGIRDLGTLVDLKAKVVTVDGEIDLTTADGELRATMLAALAAFEVRRKSERQVRANSFRVTQGKPVPGGRRRFGFEKDHLTVVESEAVWIRRAYEQVVEGASLRSIAAAMNLAGVPCVTKGSWNAPRLRKILINPAYRGMVIHHHRAWPSDQVPTIVDPELADRVAAIMADPSRRTTPGPERRALLSGLALCGTCGSPLTSAGTKSHGAAVTTYSCLAVKNRNTGGKGHPSIRRALIDPVVTNEVVKAFHHGSQEIGTLVTPVDLGIVEHEIARLNSTRAELLSLVGTVPIQDIRPRLARIGKDLEKLDLKRQRLVAGDVHLRMLRDMQTSLLGSGNIADHVVFRRELAARFDALDLDLKRQLIASLVKVTVMPGRSAERVRVEHKVVLSLNDNENTIPYPEMVTPGRDSELLGGTMGEPRKTSP